MLQSPSDDLTLELQGGEPLLAFERIKFIVALAKKELPVLESTSIL